MSRPIFHLAIPTKDVKESVEFYSKLGLETGRVYPGYAILDFYGHQVVCHLNPAKCEHSSQD